MKAISQIRCQRDDNFELHEKKKVKKMNSHTKKNLLIGSSLALFLALVVWFPSQSRSGEPEKVKSTSEDTMMESCQQMMKQKQKMMAAMQAEDAELSAQVAKMNDAPENRKMDLMAAVLTQVVEQRVARDEHKAKMQEKMMQHMMQHMQMGKKSMSQCPMMKDMKGMHKNADTTPKEDRKKQK
ncbi:MAG: hypothetical protein ABIK07_01640 [Planctomycetota bacterium]